MYYVCTIVDAPQGGWRKDRTAARRSFTELRFDAGHRRGGGKDIQPCGAPMRGIYVDADDDRMAGQGQTSAHIKMMLARPRAATAPLDPAGALS